MRTPSICPCPPSGAWTKRSGPVLLNLEPPATLWREAREAQALGCTYITLGHIFPTGCKPGVPPWGVELLRAGLPGSPSPGVCHRRDLSGLFPAVLQAGAAGACVMSGPMTCPDVRAYFQSFQDRAHGAERSQL